MCLSLTMLVIEHQLYRTANCNNKSLNRSRAHFYLLRNDAKNSGSSVSAMTLEPRDVAGNLEYAQYSGQKMNS